MDAKTGYVVKWRFSARMRFMLWLEGDESDSARDHFFKSPDTPELTVCNTRASLRRVAIKNGLVVSRQTAQVIDMGRVRSCLKALRAHEKTPKQTSICLLRAWNALDDLAYSVGDRGYMSRSRAKKWNALYQKIFWANELPAVTPVGKHFFAVFRKSEIAYLRDLLGARGSTLLEKAKVF